MTLQQIRYILEISQCGSISKAANNLLLTQPYLSSMLRDLENELGIVIFTRNHRGVTLTEKGKEFLFYARPLLEQEQRIKDLYSRQTEEPPLHFSISTQRYPFVIKAFLDFFHSWSPDHFQIQIRECNMYQVINHVYEKQSDLGIIFLSNATKSFIKKYLESRDIEFHELICIAPCIFFRKDHPMAGMEEIDASEMAPYPFASFESEPSVSLDFSEETMLANLGAVNRHFTVTDRGTMINILTHTDAFSIGSGILSPGFAGPELISRPVKGHDCDIHLGWIQCKGTALSSIDQSFIDALTKTLQTHD